MRKAEVDEQDVVRLYRDGMTVRDLCRKYGASHVRISDILKGNGIQPREFRKRQMRKLEGMQEEDVVAMYRSKGPTEAAARLGTTAVVLYGYLRKRNVRLNNSLSFYRTVDYIELESYYGTHSLKECAEKFGVSADTIRNALSKKNITKSASCLPRKKSEISERITADELRSVVEYLAGRYGGRDIARILGISEARVSEIRHGK